MQSSSPKRCPQDHSPGDDLEPGLQRCLLIQTGHPLVLFVALSRLAPYQDTELQAGVHLSNGSLIVPTDTEEGAGVALCHETGNTPEVPVELEADGGPGIEAIPGALVPEVPLGGVPRFDAYSVLPYTGVGNLAYSV